jgi:hypothetical protein
MGLAWGCAGFDAEFEFLGANKRPDEVLRRRTEPMSEARQSEGELLFFVAVEIAQAPSLMT